jgi:hypothetical protein
MGLLNHPEKKFNYWDTAHPCPSCHKRPSEVGYTGYAVSGAIELCQFCAKQLARKILEDLCDLAGDRHG